MVEKQNNPDMSTEASEAWKAKVKDTIQQEMNMGRCSFNDFKALFGPYMFCTEDKVMTQCMQLLRNMQNIDVMSVDWIKSFDTHPRNLLLLVLTSPQSHRFDIKKLAKLCVDSRVVFVFCWVVLLRKCMEDLDSLLMQRFEGWADCFQQCCEDVQGLLPEKYHSMIHETVLFGFQRLMKCVDSLFLHVAKDPLFCTFKDLDVEPSRFCVGTRRDDGTYRIHQVQAILWMLEIVEHDRVFIMTPHLVGKLNGENFVTSLCDFFLIDSSNSSTFLRSVTLSLMNGNVVASADENTLFLPESCAGTLHTATVTLPQSKNIIDISGYEVVPYNCSGVTVEGEGNCQVSALHSAASLLCMLKMLPATKVRKDLHKPLAAVTMGDDMKSMWRVFERCCHPYHDALTAMVLWMADRCRKGCQLERGEALTVTMESTWDFLVGLGDNSDDVLYEFFGKNPEFVRFLRGLQSEDAIQRITQVCTDKGKKRPSTVAPPQVKKVARIVKQVESSSCFVADIPKVNLETCERIKANYAISDGVCTRCRKRGVVLAEKDKYFCVQCFSKYWCLVLLNELKKTNVAVDPRHRVPSESLFVLDEQGFTVWERELYKNMLKRDRMTVYDCLCHAISYMVRRKHTYSVDKLWSDCNHFQTSDILNSIKLFEMKAEALLDRLHRASA